MAIGRQGDVSGFRELLDLLRSPAANVRRLAASALGKISGLGVNASQAVAALAPVARQDPHGQTRQYAIRDLKAYGAAARDCLSDLCDQADNPAEKDYVRSKAYSAAEFIEEAVRIAEGRAQRQRCSIRVTAEEYARSEQVFQRVFCDRCFDEVFLRRRNFETGVELNLS